MTVVLLSVHVVASIVLVGPMTVAASLFPRYAGAAGPASDPGPSAVAAAMHRISRVYAIAALVVPVFGLATAVAMNALGQVWVQVSVALTLVAAVLLVIEVVPGQRRVLDTIDEHAGAVTPAMLSRLRLTTGLFALTWVVVVVLMIVRPGSTTGVRA